jgi:hypothetical protein
MPGNNFTITINGNDKFSDVLKKIKGNIGGLQLPAEKTGAAVRNISKNSSLGDFNKSLTDSSNAAGSVRDAVTSIIPPFGKLAALASVAGIGEMMDKFGQYGRTMRLAASYTGMATDQLQLWEGAGRAAGLVAGQMTDTMTDFSKRIEDAVYTRDPTLMTMAARFRIKLTDQQGHAIDPDSVIDNIAKAISDQPNPKIKTAIIDAFGLNSIKPFLIDGLSGIERFKKAARDTGFIQTPEQIVRANEFQQAMAEANMATEGFAHTISSELTPVFTPLVQEYKNWISAHKDMIAQHMRQTIVDLAPAFKTVGAQAQVAGGYFKAAGSEIFESGKDLGLWKDAADLTAKAIDVTLIGALLKLSKVFLASPIGKTMAAISLLVETIDHPNWIIDDVQKMSVRGYNYMTGSNLPEPKETDKNYHMGAAINEIGKSTGETIDYFKNSITLNNGYATPAPPSPVFKKFDNTSANDNTSDAAAGSQTPTLNVRVDFANAPRGMKVTTLQQGDIDAAVNVLHSAPPSTSP